MSDLEAVLGIADTILRASGSLSDKLCKICSLLEEVDRSGFDPLTGADLDSALDAMRRAANDDLSGVAKQYTRLVQTSSDTPSYDRVFFALWQRTSRDPVEACLMLCRVNRRNLDLLSITRSRPFVQALVARLYQGQEHRTPTYPEAILSSRVQGIEILAAAGVQPKVLFLDFVKTGDCGIDPATAGGLLFDSFADSFLKTELCYVERAFPNVVSWLEARDLLEERRLRLLVTAYVQAHDLCGHTVPYHLTDPVRVQVEWFLRAPLEEYYADCQAIWIYSNPRMRAFMSGVLSEDEMDAIPVVIAMKRLTCYAMFGANDHDARCSWMFFRYWTQSGLLRENAAQPGTFLFDFDRVAPVAEKMLSDILDVERAIGDGADAYEQACRRFSKRFGSWNPTQGTWEMPEDLRVALGVSQ